MNQADSGSNANSLICALSGQSPILDPVVTPSGRICSKRLLLSKLVETNGRDPFTDAYLDESKLVDIHIPFADASVVPPRLSGANTFPSLLNTLQAEYDALILELYDTRKALEETRRELSMALYQNDAAVRVIARTLTERDTARAELSRFSVSVPTNNGPNKRKRVEEENEPLVGALEPNKAEEEEMPKTPNIVEMDVEDAKMSSSTTNPPRKIPSPEMQAMIQKREELSSSRKILMKKVKQDGEKDYATMDTFKVWECLQKKNWHKTSAKPGILALAGPVVNSSPHTKIVTHGRDKQIIVYSTTSETIVKTISFKATIAFLDLFHDPTAGNDWIYVCDSDGVVTSYTGPEFETIATTSLSVGENETVVGMVIHPTGRFLFVATNHGHVFMLSLTVDGSTLHVASKTVDETLNHEDKVEYSCTGLHPDGLLLAVGRTDGKISMWDLQSCTIASSFVGAKDASITHLVLSENGYHMASASSKGDVTVWDLRKSAKVDSFQIPSNGDNHIPPLVTRLSFCPLGKYLSCGTKSGQVYLCPVKDMSQAFTLATTSKHEGGISGLLWGVNAQSLITCNDHDRGVQFWGIPSKDP